MNRFQLVEKDGVARLALKSGPANLLDRSLMLDLARTVRELTQRQGKTRPRVLVLASDVPDQFSMGIDPKAILETDMDGRKAVFFALADLIEALWFGYIPVVADVSGPAVAGGAVLAATADFAVMSSRAGKVSFSEVKVGVPLPFFIQRIVQRRIIPSSWNEVMLLGRNLDAKEALRIGFAQSVYDGHGDRDEEVASMVERVARLSPEVLADTLRQGREPDRTLVDEFRGAMGRFADFLTDDFLVKGLKAVAKGESPRF